MATVNIYDQGNNATYSVAFNLKQTQLADVEPTGEIDFYIDVSTTMRQLDGTVFPHFVVRTLDDVPPGETTATDFSNLCSKYITYFIDQTEFIASSSSSSTSSSSSSSQSESSSSNTEYYSTSSSSSEGNSSSSSSSSSEGNSSSSSSSSSEGNTSSSSSSSEGNSSSSSSQSQ